MGEDGALTEGGEREGRSAGRRGVVLSGANWELLVWAHLMKFLVLEQVARWFPVGPPNPHRPRKEAPTAGALRRRERPGSHYLRERLRKLVSSGVLRRVPLYTEPSGAILPGQLGHELLVGTGRSQGLSLLKAIDWKSFEHDRAVTDLRWLFEKERGATWKSEREIRREVTGRHIPDAIVTMEGRSIAVEVELTRKSLPRYLQIFEDYSQGSGVPLDHVLYVVPSAGDLEHMFGSVLPAARQRGVLERQGAPSMGRFLFTTPSAIRERKVWWSAQGASQEMEGRL
jgi:hypothetical protein